MQKISSSLAVIFFIFNIHILVGQKNTYSPYSRYGIGELYKTGISTSKAMGGAGIGLRLKNQINLLNPVSYSAQDTLSFLLDFGLSFSNTKYENSILQSNHKNGEFSHLVLSFPVTNWMYISAGMAPFSKVGYNISGLQEVDPDLGVDSVMEKHYEGSGGLNKYFIGTSLKFKNFSVGVNMHYLLGTMETKKYFFFPEDVENGVYKNFTTETTDKLVISDIYFGFGAQYTFKLGNDITSVLGITYDLNNKSDLFKNSFTRTYLTGSNVEGDTVENKERIKSSIELPARLGFGASLNIKQKFVFAVDYSVQDWTGYKNVLANDNSILSKAEHFNFGFQYTPNYKAIRGYLNHVNFNCGAYFSKTYMTINNEHLKDYGISFGLDLPFLNSRSLFHINYQYGGLGTTKNNLVKQTYHYINLSLTLHDFWFIKSKFD